MEMLAKLWIAIPAAAAAVWFWNFLSWAALDLHGGDFRKLPDEPGVMGKLREFAIPPGCYFFPHTSHAKKDNAAFKALWEAGPTGVMTIYRKPNMAANMALSFAVNLAVAVLIGYLASVALPAGAEWTRVFLFTSAAGVLAYALSPLVTMIWFQGSGRAKVMTVIDGLMSGAFTGIAFALLWPSA